MWERKKLLFLMYLFYSFNALLLAENSKTNKRFKSPLVIILPPFQIHLKFSNFLAMLKWVREDCFRILQNLDPTFQFLFIRARNFRNMFFPEHITTLSKIFGDLLLPIVQSTMHQNQEPQPIVCPPVPLLSHTTCESVPLDYWLFSYTNLHFNNCANQILPI